MHCKYVLAVHRIYFAPSKAFYVRKVPVITIILVSISLVFTLSYYVTYSLRVPTILDESRTPRPAFIPTAKGNFTKEESTVTYEEQKRAAYKENIISLALIFSLLAIIPPLIAEVKYLKRKKLEKYLGKIRATLLWGLSGIVEVLIIIALSSMLLGNYLPIVLLLPALFYLLLKVIDIWRFLDRIKEYLLR